MLSSSPWPPMGRHVYLTSHGINLVQEDKDGPPWAPNQAAQPPEAIVAAVALALVQVAHDGPQWPARPTSHLHSQLSFLSVEHAHDSPRWSVMPTSHLHSQLSLLSWFISGISSGLTSQPLPTSALNTHTMAPQWSGTSTSHLHSNTTLLTLLPISCSPFVSSSAVLPCTQAAMHEASCDLHAQAQHLPAPLLHIHHATIRHGGPQPLAQLKVRSRG